MAVVVDSGPITATLKLHQVPREKWLDLMRVRRDYMHIKLSYDCRCLVEFVNDAKTMHQELGFDDAESMIRDGYQLSPEIVEWAINGLKKLDPEEPVSLDKAVILGKHYQKLDAEDRENQRPVGTNQYSEGLYDTKNDIQTHNPTGTSAAAALRRLRKDRPDLHAHVLAGELTANAAMVQAGFRKPAPNRKKAPLHKVQRIWSAATSEEREEIAAWIDDQMSPLKQSRIA